MSSDPKRMLKQEMEKPLPGNPQVQPFFELLRNDAIQRLEDIIKAWGEDDEAGG